MDNKSEYLQTALAAAQAAEQVILKYFNENGIASRKKEDGTPITVADQEAEEVIKQVILERFPDHSFFGEETGRSGDSEYVWIVDPIDGTKNFTRGLPLFGTLIALMKNGEIIVGVSNMPVLQDLIYAEKGRGAYCGDERLQVSTVNELQKTYISVGGLLYFEPLGLLEKIVRIRERVFQFRVFGDIYAYHLLAKGKIDAVAEGSIKLYDIAPFKVIIDEAGGSVSTLMGGELSFDTGNFLATNGNLHKDMLSLLHN